MLLACEVMNENKDGAGYKEEGKKEESKGKIRSSSSFPPKLGIVGFLLICCVLEARSG